MIRIRAEEHSKYAFLICALCGEILKDDLRGALGGERLARRTVQKAREDRLITERKTPLGKIIRLTKNGYDELSKIPPLKLHYDVLTKHHTFSQDKTTLQRRRAMARTILTFTESETPVSGISLFFDNRPGRKKAPAGVNDTVLNPVFGKELFTGLDHVFVTYESSRDFFTEPVVSFSEHAARIASLNAGFFPSNIVKRHFGSERSTAGNMNSTRSKGQLFGGETSYAVYYMDKAPQDTPAQNELRYAEYILDVYEKLYGAAALRKLTAGSRKGKAIIIGGELSALPSFVMDEKDRLMKNSVSAKNVLPSIYSEIHFFAFGRKNPSWIIKPGWEEDLLRQYYLPAERNRAEHAGAGRHIKAVVDRKGIKMLSMPLFTPDIVRIGDSISEILLMGEHLHILCPREYEQQISKIYEPYEKAHIELIEMEE